MSVPPPSTDVLVVFGVAAAVALFVTERLPVDVTAIAVIVALVALNPWTHVEARDAVSGFANPAVVTTLGIAFYWGT